MERGAGGGCRYDLVVASYVLAELRTAAERRRVVAQLWARTQGALLLVEPGTPVGSANVREARTQVLRPLHTASLYARACSLNFARLVTVPSFAFWQLSI